MSVAVFFYQWIWQITAAIPGVIYLIESNQICVALEFPLKRNLLWIGFHGAFQVNCFMEWDSIDEPVPDKINELDSIRYKWGDREVYWSKRCGETRF